jgi:hypothetical protein
MILAALSCVAAQSPRSSSNLPPETPFGDEYPSESRPNPPSDGIVLGSYTVAFEKTTLAEVIKASGTGLIKHAGDAGGSQYWLCYTVPSSSPSTLWVISHGEMGGSDHVVTSLAWMARTDDASPAECPSLASQMLPISLSNGLKLGDSADVVTRILGAPQEKRDGWVSFAYEGKVEDGGQCSGGLDLGNWLIIDTTTDTIQSLHAGQVTSC